MGAYQGNQGAELICHQRFRAEGPSVSAISGSRVSGSRVSGLRVALDVITGRREYVLAPDARAGTAAAGPALSVSEQRDALARVLYLSEQGFWSGGRGDDSPFGTAWGTSTDRYLRDRYLDQADAILAAGFRKAPELTRGEVETALSTEGSPTEADDWIVVACNLGIAVREGG